MLKSNHQEKTLDAGHHLQGLFSHFVENHHNPVIFTNSKNIDNASIIYYNKAFKKAFINIVPFKKNLTFFLKNFSFQTEPVNISASKENLKALLKKSGEIFILKTQLIDSEFLTIEFIKKETEGPLTGKPVTNDYAEFIDLLPEIVFEINHDFHLTFLNKQALNLFGIDHESLQEGIHIKELIPRNDYHKVEHFLNELFEGKTIKDKTIPVVKKNGEIILLEVYLNIIRYGVKINGIRGIGIDITHRKKIEEKIIEAKIKSEEADKLKTTFLMNMSHEIRTPLNSVLGFTQLLLRKTNNPEHKSYLQSIKSSGKDLLKLFNDLIDLSKIYANQLDVIKTETNLNTIFDILTKEFKTEIELKKKPLELTTYKGLKNEEANVLLDDDRLKQVFTTLFDNALKFTKEGFIEFGYQINDRNIHFFMKDSGLGMDKEIQKQVFEFFYQPAGELGELNRGSGIGLAIIKGIIDKMGGKIWVESDSGKGALINFLLPYVPLDKNIDTTSVDVENHPISLQNFKILIIEDDEDNICLLQNFLEITGASLNTSKNGIEAVEIMKNNKFDVVFMDIDIPGINGIEATKQIRKFNKDVIIIAQSAYVDKTDKEKCYRAGCDAFIEKPIFSDVLLNTLSGILTVKRNRNKN